jgi:hypothetical protein
MRNKSFHLDGKVPVESGKFKMCKRGDFNPLVQSLTKEGETPSFSGPLFALRLEIAASKSDMQSQIPLKPQPSDGPDRSSVSESQALTL